MRRGQLTIKVTIKIENGQLWWKYRFKQGNDLIKYKLNRDSRAILKLAEEKAEDEFQRQAHPAVALRVVGSD
jgi:hypothetical protein